MFKYTRIRRAVWLAALLASVALLGACTDEPTPGDTETNAPSETAPVTEASPTESDPAGETEAETLPPLSPEAPTVAEKFAISEIFSIPPVEKQETVDVALPGSVTVTVNASSTFFGTESAIDRDSHHLGDMIRYNNLRVTDVQTEFRTGDLNGDRTEELLTYKDGTLTAYRLGKRGACSVVYSQRLGFAGTLCGAGLFNGDRYTDLLFYSADAARLVLATGSATGFTYVYGPELTLKEGEQLFTGDFNGDGVEDLIVIHDLTVTSYRLDAEELAPTTTTLAFAEPGQYLRYAVGDINSDGADDVIGFMRDPAGSKTEGGGEVYGTCAYLSRLDGQFGTYEGEENNKNVNVVHINAEGLEPLYVAGGDITGDGVDDLAVVGRLSGGKRVDLYAGVFPEEAPAYDYSSHIIKTEDGYILYTGGLYVDYNTDKYPPTDADHIMAYTSKDGLVWHRNLDAPCFYLGSELKADRVPEDLTPGTYENWWVSNTMEPEVLYVDGTYYMYYQCEYYQLDKSGKLMGADRIGVATSKDGIHFERKTDFPALISSDIYSCFTHQEVIYVPDDPDGLPFWMYVRYVHNNVETKRIRVRSADPTVFDMDKDYAECEGLNHIGNQLGYISDYDGKGNRLFVRMTMQDYNGDGKGQRWVPSLQFSADGVHWILSDLRMASANLDIPSEAERPNIFFLGFSTINGTGEIAKNAEGKYEFFFVGGTGSSSVAPGIFYSSEGLGKVEFTVDVKD